MVGWMVVIVLSNSRFWGPKEDNRWIIPSSGRERVKEMGKGRSGDFGVWGVRRVGEGGDDDDDDDDDAVVGILSSLLIKFLNFLILNNSSLFLNLVQESAIKPFQKF